MHGRWRHNVSGSRRTTTGFSACPTPPRRRRSPRPTASSPASSIPTAIPTTTPPRSASRRCRRRTTCSVTTPSARSTTRFAGSGPMGAPGADGGGFRFNVSDMQAGRGFGDLFERLFGAHGDGGGGEGVGPRRGDDVQRRADARVRRCRVRHDDHAVSDHRCPVRRDVTARERPGTSPKLCPQCGGRGVVDDNQGLFSFSTPCRRVRGAGHIVEDPCPTCRGSGVEKRPARCRPHPRRCQRRPGHPAQGPQRVGSTAAHPATSSSRSTSLPHRGSGATASTSPCRYRRVTWQAALGDVIGVPTLRRRRRPRLKPGTQSGSRHRVKGKGIKTPRPPAT